MGSLRARRTTGVAATAVLALVVIQVALAGNVVDPRKEPHVRTTAADNSRAKSSLIRLSDVFAGFRIEASQESKPVIPHCSTYPGDRSNVTVTGSATSSFRRNSNSIASTVLWFKTKADSDRYWTKTVRTAYIQCLAQLLEFDGVKPHIALADQVEIQPNVAEKSVAYRLVGASSGSGSKPFNWIETVAFVKKGRGIAVLRVIWINSICNCHNELGAILARRLSQAA